MKKYIVAASLFILNSEIVWVIVLCVISVMVLVDLAAAVDRERGRK